MHNSQIYDIGAKTFTGRRSVTLRQNDLYRWIGDQRLVVTGAGGSIGSELCRQIAYTNPKMLMIIDRNSNALNRIKNRLHREFPLINLCAITADSSDQENMKSIFWHKNISLILHAAAHKHLPLAEQHPLEVSANNVLGTYRLLSVARDLGIPRFILISSDKAVYPSSVMGATKRLGELLVRSFNSEPNIICAAVRFGNVLGSSGSVLPLFQQQLQTGGPITVTHSEMKRYFMGVHEAVSLVLQASYLATGGEIFVLDMGTQVKITDLAKRLILFSGLQPEKDISIKFIGKRTGEKLQECLTYSNEKLIDSSHPGIRFTRQVSTPTETLIKTLTEIETAVRYADGEAALIALESLLPRYKASDVAWQAVSPSRNTTPK